jgi:hypothetical protein
MRQSKVFWSEEDMIGYRMPAVVLASAASLLPGCSHVTAVRELNGQVLSEDGKTLAHVNANCWGIYLFNLIPIMSGSRDHPESPTMFEDTANVEDVVGLLTRKSKALGASRTSDLQSIADSWWQGWTLIFWMKAAYASGNAIADAPAQPQPLQEPSVPSDLRHAPPGYRDASR